MVPKYTLGTLLKLRAKKLDDIKWDGTMPIIALFLFGFYLLVYFLFVDVAKLSISIWREDYVVNREVLCSVLSFFTTKIKVVHVSLEFGNFPSCSSPKEIHRL